MVFAFAGDSTITKARAFLLTLLTLSSSDKLGVLLALRPVLADGFVVERGAVGIVLQCSQN